MITKNNIDINNDQWNDVGVTTLLISTFNNDVGVTTKLPVSTILLLSIINNDTDANYQGQCHSEALMPIINNMIIDINY